MAKKLREILKESPGLFGAHHIGLERFKNPSTRNVLGITQAYKKFRANIGLNAIARWHPNRVMQRLKGKLGIYNNPAMTQARQMAKGSPFRTFLGVGQGGSSAANSLNLQKSRRPTKPLAARKTIQAANIIGHHQRAGSLPSFGTNSRTRAKVNSFSNSWHPSTTRVKSNF